MIPRIPGTVPPAFVGYAPHPKGGFRVKVCEHHGEAETRRATLWAHPLEVVRTICPQCAQSRMARLLGEGSESQQ